MSIICSCCKNALDGEFVINCPSCNAFVCDDCAKKEAMLCPYCHGELYFND